MAPNRLLCPWDSPGKNTGVDFHFFLQCMKMKNETEVTQSCPTLSDPMDCSLPGSSVHGILQARLLEWVAIAFSECLGYCASKEHYLFSKIYTRGKAIWKFKRYKNEIQFSSVQYSCSVVSDYLRPHELQHDRPHCPSPTPGVHSASRPSSH